MPAPLLDAYQASLTGKSPGTIANYMRALHKLTDWIATLPGSNGTFQPHTFTRTAMQTYLNQLEQDGYSASYRNLVKSAASGFAEWLIDGDLLQRNPTRRIQIEATTLMAPRELTFEQRYVLKNLVERAEDVRGQAMFALGYWTGCRVSDVSHLFINDVHLQERSGWIKVGFKGNKKREIDLNKAVRDVLGTYLNADHRRETSPYVFTSQRSDRLTEAGIHHWFRTLKASARKDEWELIEELSFHDLRHDFAHRAREAGWSLEEIAFYLGHTTKRGTPAIQTTVRYTQANRTKLRKKIKHIYGQDPTENK